MQSAVSKRIQSAIKAYSESDYETSFYHLFSALDVTAKRRYPAARKVGVRNELFLKDIQDIVLKLYIGYSMELDINGVTFPKLISEFGRNSLIHDGELSERFVISEEQGISIGENWTIHHSIIACLITAVIVARENRLENAESDTGVRIRDETFPLNDLWGKEVELREKLK